MTKMPKFLCPKCCSLLTLLGLTPNKVYEIFRCHGCNMRFEHSRTTYSNPRKPENYARGWSTNHDTLRYEDEIPTEVKPTEFIFR